LTSPATSSAKLATFPISLATLCCSIDRVVSLISLSGCPTDALDYDPGDWELAISIATYNGQVVKWLFCKLLNESDYAVLFTIIQHQDYKEFINVEYNRQDWIAATRNATFDRRVRRDVFEVESARAVPHVYRWMLENHALLLPPPLGPPRPIVIVFWPEGLPNSLNADLALTHHHPATLAETRNGQRFLIRRSLASQYRIARERDRAAARRYVRQAARQRGRDVIILD
ncbi:hypothetical protein KCV07_g9205, partial [Aureobasidium melanogenum]